MTRVILASASPARLQTLRNAGIEPEVIVSGVPEDGVRAESTAELALELARLKACAVAEGVQAAGLIEDSGHPKNTRHHEDSGHPETAKLSAAAKVTETTVVIGCDSVLDLDGQSFGKPGTPERARERWLRMRGRSGVLHTGHHLIAIGQDSVLERGGVGSTTVHFADLDEAEIAAYVETGEPLQVAGSFTLDGLGGAYVSRIEGDPHNVVGISLPLLRTLLAELGIAWHTLWR